MLKGLSPKIDDVKHDLSNLEIYELALNLDPEFSAKFGQNDTYRLNKWYSIYKTTNQIPSLFLKENTSKPTIKNLEIYEIYAPKEILNNRISLRTKKMIKDGIVDEATYLFGKYDNSLKSLNSVGLKECKEFLNGEISLSKLEELITTHTIQLAKRQRTFNKSQFDKKLTLPLDKLKFHLEARLKNH